MCYPYKVVFVNEMTVTVGHMMSGRGSNASLNLLEEKVRGNLMDCSKASVEFKGHRRAHSFGSQGHYKVY